jgi:hypothetical protein
MIDETEAPRTPPIDPATFDRLRDAVVTAGPAAAAEQLVAYLRDSGDFPNLFYALLLKKRVELGVSPFPTGPSSELPSETHEPYENAIRQAGREVGHALLARKQFLAAWTFFRMLDEPEPVRAALEEYRAGDDDESDYAVIELAWQTGLAPKKGFDVLLERRGLCSAITLVSGADLSRNPELRDYCYGKLVRTLYEQLRERLRHELVARGTEVPADATVAALVESHPELFADDAYHIDTSHLSSVVQMSTYLPPGQDNELAQELCEYGRRLAPALQGRNDPPFDDGYEDYLAFLKVIAGSAPSRRTTDRAEVEAGLARFRGKAERQAAEGSTYAAQVYVQLLVRTDRPIEALAAARQFLLAEDERNLICPGVSELAKKLGDFETVAEAARARNDLVNFVAGLIAARATAD